jgi:predicted phage tail component-like protein
MNTIIFKGVSSQAVTGLLISQLPSIISAGLRTENIEVDGRDGDITRNKGYSTYEKTVEIGLHGNFNIDAVINYFSGAGKCIFSNEPDKVYDVRITNQTNYDRLVRFRKAKIKMKVQPFKKLVVDEPLTASTSPLSVVNDTFLPLKPIITIEGNVGDIIALKVGNTTVMTVTIPPEGTITIDNEALNCYNSNADKNQYVQGDFFELPLGTSSLNWSPAVTQVTVNRNRRYL